MGTVECQLSVLCIPMLRELSYWNCSALRLAEFFGLLLLDASSGCSCSMRLLATLDSAIRATEQTLVVRPVIRY